MVALPMLGSARSVVNEMCVGFVEPLAPLLFAACRRCSSQSCAGGRRLRPLASLPAPCSRQARTYRSQRRSPRSSADCSTATMRVACDELQRGLSGLLGKPISARNTALEQVHAGAIVHSRRTVHTRLGTRARWFLIELPLCAGGAITLQSSRNRDIGALYGVFALLRLIQTRRDIAHLDVPTRRSSRCECSTIGTISMERSSAAMPAGRCGIGTSFRAIDPRLIDYARANASIGINGAVLNNVNADARILTPDYLRKVAARRRRMAALRHPRLSLARASPRRRISAACQPPTRSTQACAAGGEPRRTRSTASSPISAGSSSRPIPRGSRARRPMAEPMPTARTCSPPPWRRIAASLLWRAFVYSGAAQEDRAKQAYDEFKPLDGKFAPTSSSRSRTGRSTSSRVNLSTHCSAQWLGRALAMEVQITKEYLGESTHLAYLGTDVVRGAAQPHGPAASPGRGSADSLAAIAGVANTGSDRNWTGSDFDQANWYAFGRLAWNPRQTRRRSRRNGPG